MKLRKIFAFILSVIITLSLFPLAVQASGRDFTTVDALTALQASMGFVSLTDEQSARYDMNGDGSITIVDALMILRVSMGLPAEDSPGITPLMWLVTSPGGQTMYLFGSIHVADASIYPLPRTIMNAFRASDYLAVEFDSLAYDDNPMSEDEYIELFVYPAGRSINDDLDRELIRLARRAIRDSGVDIGIPIQMLDRFKPIVWWDILNYAALEKSGLSYEYGLDDFFLREAYRRGMGILEIESAESQASMLSGFSNELVSVLIASALDIDEEAAGIIELYDIWKRGDEAAITALTRPSLDELDDYPEYRELMEEYIDGMATQRDILMAEAARQYMANGMKVFYVVGLAHLVGEGSVVDLLRQAGYTVELVVI
jgi:hypothetical protein